jgi:HlyD family type I secretion membrane fusion protein
MSSENSPNKSPPSVPGSTSPAIWRRCVELLTGSGGSKTKFDATGPSLNPPGGGLGAPPVPDWKRPALAGYFIIFLGFGVLGGWSAFARLDSAVVASGTVTLESSKKIIQHFEGGIIAKILVHEGEHVEQGQILFLLDNTAPKANANAVHNQLDAYLAQEARLVAERNGAEKVTYPTELADDASQPVIKDAISDQSKQFAERRASLAGQIAILESRIKQFGTQIDGITDEKKSTEQQLGFINSELTDLRELLAENLVQKTRVLALERERARLEGVIGRAVADVAKAQNDIGEAHLQIEQLHKKFSEDVNDQILQVRQKIAELREKTAVSQDVLQRIQIRAPRSGTIQNLRVATVGGVIRPGEPLAELIPEEDNLVINAEVSPTDADAIDAGMEAEVRFSAFHGYNLPLILGHVDTVSHDRSIDEQTKQPYFLARVVVNQADVPTMVKDHIKAGMPVEVMVPTGERTVMNYLIRPLRNRANSAFREK